jgi:carboxypeptidase T
VLRRRRVLSRVRSFFVPGRALRPRRLALFVGAALAAALTTVAMRPLPAPSGTPTRVAIRVACDTPEPCAFAERIALDVWSEHSGPGMPLDVVVAHRDLARLDAAGVRWQLLVADIDAVARAEAVRLRSPEAQRPGDWFADFRDYEAIGTYLHVLATANPARAEVHAIGGSLDGRPIWALRIGGTAPGATPMLVNGTQHAREWISAMVATCVADRLVRDYDSDPQIRAFVDSTELWLVPVVNPDGYQHSWASDRYWRKNRRARHGVDLNRNFGVAWGGPGSSRREGAQDYRGAYAFSEPESAALRDLVKREGIQLHIDFHAYGQLVLYPWGHTSTPTDDRDRFAAVGDRMASALYAAHHTHYKLMPASGLYRASGIMTDWMYGEAGALSYTIELRPKGGTGFVLPPEQIRPTCDEGLAAVLALRAARPRP